MEKIIGTVTIGQSPRVDIVPEISAILGPDVKIAEAGALDGLTKEQIAEFAPVKGDYVLVTRLADGSSVQIAEHYITPLIRKKIQGHFDRGIPLVFLLCTGEFPGFDTAGLLIRPQKVLFNAVSAVAEGMRLGILTPSPQQVEQSERRWKEASQTVLSVPASPYVDAMSSVEEGARKLKDWNVQISVLDCMGYTLAMQKRVREITGRPVILARGIAARTVAELIG
ncbi:AroM family protein [Aminivibrio sp.]